MAKTAQIIATLQAALDAVQAENMALDAAWPTIAADDHAGWQAIRDKTRALGAEAKALQARIKFATTVPGIATVAT